MIQHWHLADHERFWWTNWKPIDWERTARKRSAGGFGRRCACSRELLIVSTRCKWARLTLHTPGSSLFNNIGGRSAVRVRIRIRIRIRISLGLGLGLGLGLRLGKGLGLVQDYFRSRIRIRFRWTTAGCDLSGKSELISSFVVDCPPPSGGSPKRAL